MKKFNLENQYQKYLKLIKMKESNMHPVQRKETRRAFIGACGQMLILLRDDVAAIEDDDEAVKVLDDMINQVSEFWLNETGKLN